MNNFFIKFLIATFLSTSLCCAAPRTERVYFVSPDGSDNNDGRSVETPWKSLEKVNASKFKPGDTIRFEGGRIFESNVLQYQSALLISDSGTPDSPIVYTSYGGLRAIIKADTIGIMCSGKEYVEFRSINVSGKGFPAALITSRLSGVVRSTMNSTGDLGLAMCQINNLMCSNMVEGRYVTYILGVIDPVNHQFQFANAGHMPPEVRTPEGRLYNAGIEMSGFPLGIDTNCKYETTSFDLTPGTMVLLRTDGVDDAMSAGGDFYGSERWREILAASQADPEIISQSLRTDIKAFSTGQIQHDDIAILCFGRLP